MALAQAVPGIDLIFGTHSHRKQELMQIRGHRYLLYRPYQYLTYMSQVAIHLQRRRIDRRSGGLVRMSNDLPEDPETAQKVAQMQADLEAIPSMRPV